MATNLIEHTQQYSAHIAIPFGLIVMGPRLAAIDASGGVVPAISSDNEPHHGLVVFIL